MTFDEEHTLETFKSLITVSMEGLKTLLLVNGGAVVALVAFLGQSSLGPSLAPHFWWPIGFFVAGVTSCTLAFLGSYFTQFSLYNELFPQRGYRGPKHMTCLTATVGFVLASVVCFALGAFTSVSVLANDLSPQRVKPAVTLHNLPRLHFPAVHQ
jgi:hypothetical protein